MRCRHRGLIGIAEHQRYLIESFIPNSKPLPTHVKLIIERNLDGSIKRFMACINSGGIHQTFEASYSETTAPVSFLFWVFDHLYLPFSHKCTLNMWILAPCF